MKLRKTRAHLPQIMTKPLTTPTQSMCPSYIRARITEVTQELNKINSQAVASVISAFQSMQHNCISCHQDHCQLNLENRYDTANAWIYQCLTESSQWVRSKFNGTSTPKGSYRAETGYNGCNVNSSRYSESKNCTVWEHSLSGQVWTKCPRPDTQGAPRGGCSLHPLTESNVRCKGRTCKHKPKHQQNCGEIIICHMP